MRVVCIVYCIQVVWEVLVVKNEVDRGRLRDFLLAGKCEFILLQDATGSRKGSSMLYKLNVNQTGNVFFMYCEGEFSKCSYQGYVSFRGNKVCVSPKRDFETDRNFNQKAYNGFRWLMNHLDSLPSTVHVLHVGKCSRCGRKLTDPESIRYGLGPECRKKVNEGYS